uniref:Uncharacterized protein n=1 Tax=viral metagenome TaxID=1070528 RepID=A0A6M3M4B0_9ZZZZ
MRNEELKDILFLLAEDEECILVCAGPHGRVIAYDDSAMPDEAVIISEYGEITTVGAVRESVPFAEAKPIKQGEMPAKCRICGSHARHGRKPNTDLDLCDVCYWRKQAGELETLLCDLAGDWPIDCASNALDAARVYLKHGYIPTANEIQEDANWRDHNETIALPWAIQ